MVLFAAGIRQAAGIKQLQISLSVTGIKEGRKRGYDRGTEGKRKGKESGLS